MKREEKYIEIIESPKKKQKKKVIITNGRIKDNKKDNSQILVIVRHKVKIVEMVVGEINYSSIPSGESLPTLKISMGNISLL